MVGLVLILSGVCTFVLETNPSSAPFANGFKTVESVGFVLKCTNKEIQRKWNVSIYRGEKFLPRRSR